jgi:hypothetical protein
MRDGRIIEHSAAFRGLRKFFMPTRSVRFSIAAQMLIWFVLCPIASGQQVPDPKFKAVVDQPAYADKHPQVFFDEAHFNVHTAKGSYQAFVSLIKSDGYAITINDKPFTSDSLAKYDVLVTSNARGSMQRSEKSAFTEAECDAVRDWVQSGGALLLVVDHYPTGHAAEALAKRFAINLSKGRTVDRANTPPGGIGGIILFSRDKNSIGDHVIMRGRSDAERITRVATFTGESLKGPADSFPLLLFSDSAIDFLPSDAAESGPGARPRAGGPAARPGNEPQTSAAGRSQGLALKFGKGRVVVLGEASQLSAQLAGPQQRAMGMNYEGCDNRQFAINIMHWLSGLID